ncbi:protein FATTY ACID EXPORT 4, chloroplastic isoform X3 [Actinidia eriantha]|uniref:protein FATTY ACID EXPORT 4, chloroplastic isoform X3 n=1 Tax=Actinidia eriantha TaxID=165200 RepID=UPI00258C6AE1|nr:protein FATTY ACID EXPORT 4, chloroplastic isoform X3 [Actinidia eriantha]
MDYCLLVEAFLPTQDREAKDHCWEDFQSYILMQATEMKEIGDALAFGSALLFASVFGIRLAATRKIIPAGPLLGLSICALAVFISAYLQDSL